MNFIFYIFLILKAVGATPFVVYDPAEFGPPYDEPVSFTCTLFWYALICKYKYFTDFSLDDETNGLE